MPLAPPRPPPGAAKQTTIQPGSRKLPPPSPPKGVASAPSSAPPPSAPVEQLDELAEEQYVEQPTAPAEPGARTDYRNPFDVRAQPPASLLPRTAKLLRSVHEELTMGTLDLAGHPSGRYLRSLIDHVDFLLHFPEAAPAEAVPPEATPPEAAPPEATPPEATPPKAAASKK